MSKTIAIHRIQPRVTYTLIPILMLLTCHYVWTAYYGGPSFGLKWWSALEIKLNFFWQQYQPMLKYTFLALVLANILLLDLWITNIRRVSAHLQGTLKHPQEKLVTDIKQLTTENKELKQKLKLANMDLSLNNQAPNEDQSKQWALIRHELESQLEQANLDHKKTRQALSQLQEKANDLTQQIEQAKNSNNPSQPIEKHANAVPIELKKPNQKQAQKFDSTLKNLKSFIDENDLA